MPPSIIDTQPSSFAGGRDSAQDLKDDSTDTRNDHPRHRSHWVPPKLNHKTTPPNWMQSSVRAYKIMFWLVDFDNIENSVRLARYASKLVELAMVNYQKTKSKHPHSYSRQNSADEKSIAYPFNCSSDTAIEWFDGITKLVDIVILSSDGRLSEEQLNRLEDEYTKVKKRVKNLSLVYKKSI